MRKISIIETKEYQNGHFRARKHPKSSRASRGQTSPNSEAETFDQLERSVEAFFDTTAYYCLIVTALCGILLRVFSLPVYLVLMHNIFFSYDVKLPVWGAVALLIWSFAEFFLVKLWQRSVGLLGPEQVSARKVNVVAWISAMFMASVAVSSSIHHWLMLPLIVGEIMTIGSIIATILVVRHKAFQIIKAASSDYALPPAMSALFECYFSSK